MSYYYGPAGDNYVLSDNLVYADATAAATAGWSNNGTPNWGYATSPAPLGGYASSFSASSGSVGATCPVFTTGATTWMYFLLNVPSLAANLTFANFKDSGGSDVGTTFQVLTTGAVRIFSGSNSTSGSGVFVANQTYHVMLKYVAGNGTDSQGQIWLSTDGVFTSASVTKTNGTSTADCSRAYFSSASSTRIIMNKLRVGISQFGNNPA